MTYIIGMVSQKGGVGKSTLARMMAREFVAGGLTTKIADLDTQQQTCTHWAGPARRRWRHARAASAKLRHGKDRACRSTALRCVDPRRQAERLGSNRRDCWGSRSRRA